MSIPTFCFALKGSPRLVSVRGSTEALLGYGREEFLTAKVHLRDRIHPEDAGVMDSLFSPHLEKPSGAFNIRLRHADGRIRCIKAQYTKEPGRAGEVLLDLMIEDARNIREPGDASLIASFKTLIERTGDYIYVKNRNHVILAASRTLPNLTASANHPLELVGKTDYDIHPEEIADIGYRLEKQAIAEGRRVNQIQQLPAQDGTIRWIDSRKYPINGPGDDIIGIFSVAPDITQYIEAQFKLRENEESLRESQEIAGIGSYSLDIRAEAWTGSDVLDRIFGIGKEFERTVQGWANLIELEDRAEMVAYFTGEVLGEGKPFDKEYRIVRPSDGAVRWVHGLGRLEFDEQHRLVRMRGTIQDITEHKREEAALIESRNKLETALASMTDGVFISDADGGRVEFNEAFAAFHRCKNKADFSKSKAEYRSVFELFTANGDRAPLETWPLQRALHGETGMDVEHTLRRKDTGETWIGSSNFAPIRGRDGAIVGAVAIVRDITEKRRAETALRESGETLREAQQIAGLGSHVLNLSSGAWDASDVLREILGVGPDHDLSPAGWMALIHPEDSEAVKACFSSEAFSSGLPFEVEHRIIRSSDQAVRWVHALGRIERDEHGNPVRLRGTIQDITERKQSEAALRESKELLRLFIEQAPVALAMLDREMRHVAVSRRWLNTFSLKEDEIIGRPHYEVIPNLQERCKEAHRRGLAGEAVRADESRVEMPDGTVIWVRWEVIPWRNSNGEVGGIIIFSEDITEKKRAETALRESKELLHLFIDQAPVALAMFDREMRYLAVSRRWLEERSLVGQQIIGRSHYEIVTDPPERWKEEHRRGMAGETLKCDEDRFERADGTVLWVRREIAPWRAGDGSVGGIVLFTENITAQKQAEERLHLAASVFTGAREGIMITDPNGTILDVNDAFTRITGYTREEAMGRKPGLLKSGLQSREFYENMWEVLTREGHWSGEVWNRVKSGDLYAEMLSINAMRDASGSILKYVAHFSDLTELKERERELEHVAHFDALTGLPNRTLLADRLRQAMAQVRRRKELLAVAYIDLDGFKEINDRYGRAAGDKLLTSLAFQMKCALRQGDTLARLGGDEFVAMMLDLDSVEASASVLARLLEAAAERTQVGDLSLCVSASIGVTYYPQTEDVDADQLMRQADQAMYQAKLAGKNRFHQFDPELDITVRGRNENIGHIRHALAVRQFVLYYQPKVNMRTGMVIGAEALIRWQHPERGLLPPGMFLPVIEEHPMAIELGEWVIDTALAQMEAWQAAGLNLPVSVNVGALQLQQPDFVDRLKALLAVHPRVKASDLELEVLETSALQDLAQTSQVLQACRQIGVPVALDDFGTGYSSLTYLKHLPAAVLKIDRSFVSDMLYDPENLTILEGLLGLAAAFRRQAIAEGVETVDHGLILLQMGCELAQGYGIAPPMPAHEVQAWTAGWRPDPRWANLPLVNADSRAILYAGVEHRAWLAAFEACLEGRRATPPSLDPTQCRIGAWLNAERQSARGGLPAFQAIEALHRQFHALAAEIYSAHGEGRNTERLAGLRQLHCLHDKCLKRLQTFARTGSGKARKENSRSRAAATAGA